jgi:hypothetical protein
MVIPVLFNDWSIPTITISHLSKRDVFFAAVTAATAFGEVPFRFRVMLRMGLRLGSLTIALAAIVRTFIVAYATLIAAIIAASIVVSAVIVTTTIVALLVATAIVSLLISAILLAATISTVPAAVIVRQALNGIVADDKLNLSASIVFFAVTDGSGELNIRMKNDVIGKLFCGLAESDHTEVFFVFVPDGFPGIISSSAVAELRDHYRNGDKDAAISRGDDLNCIAVFVLTDDTTDSETGPETFLVLLSAAVVLITAIVSAILIATASTTILTILTTAIIVVTTVPAATIVVVATTISTVVTASSVSVVVSHFYLLLGVV